MPTNRPTSSPDKETPPPANGVLTQPLGTLPGSGGGMDRKLQKRRFPPKRIAMIVGVVALVALVAFALLSQRGGRRLQVERDRLTISTVQEGAFQEYVAVTGQVLPERSVYLDAVVGGKVTERLVEEGAMVTAGQPLLVLSNDNLTLQMMSSEAQLQEQISTMRAQRLALDQNQLNLQQQLAQLDYDVTRLRRERDRLADLVDDGFVSQAEYQRASDEYDYAVRRRELTRAGFRNDSLSRALQLRQMDGALDRLHRNLGLVQETMANLVVRAPVSGQLTAFNAEVGQLMAQGARIGQVDVLDGYKVRVPVDEHYITRVAPGQAARTTVDGQDYDLMVMTVYPEVRDGRFEVDMVFTSAPPATIRRGQSLRLRLELGDPEQALLLARGGFYQTSGGNYAYVLTEDGSRAVRRPIRLGRQNPQFYEVTEGLRPGDRVVTSSYDTFGDADMLVLQ
jgi:HlyD family secretion protein